MAAVNPETTLGALRKHISELEQSRNNKDHERIHREAQQQISRVEATLREIGPEGNQVLTHPDPEKNAQMTFREWLAVAVLGYLRIQHVDLNTQLKTATTQAIEDIVKKIRTLQDKRETIAKNQSFTITGDPVNWRIEHAQDDSRTELLLGNDDIAKEKLKKGIAAGEQTLRNSKTLNKNIRFGIESGIAVCEVRLAILQGNMLLALKGIVRQYRSSLITNNKARTGDLINIAGNRFIPEKMKPFAKRLTEVVKSIKSIS